MLVCGLLVACSQSAVKSPTPAGSVAVWPAPVASTPLVVRDAPTQPLLDVGVVIFEAGEGASADSAVAMVREVETRLLAIDLRRVLERSGVWGAVRLLPAPSLLAPLELSARMVHSDGRDLVLEVTATDATGRQWFSETLHGRATGGDDVSNQGSDPFVDVWHHIANRLESIWGALAPAERQALLTVAELRYAAALAPEYFSGYLGTDRDVIQPLRLPSADDPMLQRIEKIRTSELMFIDAIDEQYMDLQAAMSETYAAWRAATRARVDWLDGYGERVANRNQELDRGSFASLQSAYSTYRAVKVQEQDFFDYALGLRNETRPTQMTFEGRAVELSGSLESRYRQWRDLLADIFRIEQGFL